MSDTVQGPHQGQRVVQRGAPLAEAQGALVLLHGRGGRAEDILAVATYLERTDFAYLAPQAAGQTWYPHRFLAPLASNEPYLSSALAVVGEMLEKLAAAGIGPERTLLLGFSQGACLAAEYAARHPQRYGGVAVFSGGLIGPPEMVRQDSGSLAGTPVFLGCSDVDAHIPLERVRFSAQVFRQLGAAVTERIYPGMGHTINQEELNAVKELMAVVSAQV